MTTITTKIAESGRVSYQLDGKRASKAAAIEAAIANMKNGSDNLVDIQIAIDAAKKTVRFDINYYGEIIWQEIKSVKQYKSIGGGHYETYYSPEWTRTTEERANELFAEFGLNTEIICKMVFADNTDTTTKAEENTAQVEETEAELIKHNGLSFEGFLATNAGLTIEEYRARKDEQQAAAQAEAERRTKIFNLKDGIKSAEYKINETSGTLNDIIKNHYRPESDDGSWDEYTAELGDTLATAVSTLNTLKAQLAELEPEAETTTAEAEYKPQTEWENPHDFTTVGNLNGQPRKYVDPESIAAPKGFWADRINGNYITNINGEFVRFINHSIVEISAGKSGYSYERRNGRKNFYRYGRKIAAAKIAEAYMNGEIAAEQNKAHHEFFDAHKTAYNKFFQAYFEVTTADGNVHNFERTFDSFDDAKALVDKFTATFSEPADILIKRNGRLAPVYYTRTDGLPGTYTMFYFGEDGFDPEVFNLLPALDTLNDVDDDEPAEVNTTAHVEPTAEETAKIDRLAELKSSKLLIYKAINNALRDHYVKLESGEFYDASEAGFTTTGIEAGNPIFDKLYFKDENGAYVEVSEKAIDAFNRLEIEHGIVCDAIKAEIARTAVKFEVGKWYASDETDWNGDPYGTYRVLKRTKKFVTIYDSNNDDWHYIDNYDPDDEIDGEFDCIFRKKIQFDERGEYVDWRDEDGELVTLCAKDVTDKPIDEDPDDDNDSAEDNVEAEDATEDEPTDTADDTPEPPVDDFTAKSAELKAERDAADKRVSKLNNDLLEAQKAADKASNALYKFGDAKARELARNHLPALGFSKTTAVITQDGDAIDAPNLRHIRIDFNFRKFKFEIVADWTTFGTYDTPEQVKSVIAGLKTAIRHEEKFTFPTVETLTAPTKPEPPKVEHTPDDEDGVWTIPNKLTKKLSSIPMSTLLEVITQDGEQIFTYIAGANIEPRWGDIDRFAFVSNNHDIAVYDTPEQIEDVINLIKATIERGEEKFTFPTVKGLTAPDIDNKDNLRGSLKRAAEIARKKYHEYEREGDNDGMLYEIELYSICADAIKELEAA